VGRRSSERRQHAALEVAVKDTATV
jgi:hypothetical protein